MGRNYFKRLSGRIRLKAGSEVTMDKNMGRNYVKKKVRVDGSRSEGAEVAGSEVTMDKQYGKQLFEEKMLKVEGSR